MAVAKSCSSCDFSMQRILSFLVCFVLFLVFLGHLKLCAHFIYQEKKAHLDSIISNQHVEKKLKTIQFYFFFEDIYVCHQIRQIYCPMCQARSNFIKEE
jgi:hypothetical protein